MTSHNKYTVFLRPFLPTDLEFINKLRNDEEVQNLTTGRYRLVSLEIERNWLNSKMNNNQYEEYFAICLNDESKRIIGYFCIREIDLFNRKCNFDGIVIAKEYRTAEHLIDTNLVALNYAFIHIGVNRISGSCLAQHKDSRIMMEMLGFELEGIEKESVYKHHTYNNVCKYAILYSSYKSMMETNQYSLINIAKRVRSLKKNI